MDASAARPWTDAYTSQAACARIFERHRGSIKVRKPHVAVANLQRIIAATLKLSNRRGFHATTLRDLAGASDLSMGGLYSYIANKTTLLSMILGEVSTAVSTALGDAPEAVGEAPRDHLRWLIERHLRLTEAMQPWFAFAYMEAKAFPAAARRTAVEGEAASEAIFAAVLRRGIASGVFAIDDPDLTAALIKPLLQDWYVKRAKYRKRGTTLEAYMQAVTTLVERAVVSPVPTVSDQRAS